MLAKVTDQLTGFRQLFNIGGDSLLTPVSIRARSLRILTGSQAPTSATVFNRRLQLQTVSGDPKTTD